MITINKPKNFGGCSNYCSEVALEYYGLSADTKPTEATNGSVFMEIDTGKIFCFDREHKTWIEL